MCIFWNFVIDFVLKETKKAKNIINGHFIDILSKDLFFKIQKKKLYSCTFNFRAPICVKKGYIRALLLREN